MARPKYSIEDRNKIINMFIQATKKIIEQEGIKSVTIRKVANEVGVNSATLYLYFKDLDELITLASLTYLKDYYQSFSEDCIRDLSNIEAYLQIWEQFCPYAFSNPIIFYYIYFSTHTFSFSELFERYFSIYPEQLELKSGPQWEMFYEPTLETRNLKVLMPLVKDNLIDEKNIQIINEFIILYFRYSLEEMLDRKMKYTVEQQTEKFMKAIKFLLTK